MKSLAPTTGLLSKPVKVHVQALRALQARQDLSVSRITSGKRVMRPLDDPNNFFTAARLTWDADALDTLRDRIGTVGRGLNAMGHAADAAESLLTRLEFKMEESRTRLVAATPAAAPSPSPSAPHPVTTVTGTSTQIVLASGVTASTDLAAIAGTAIPHGAQLDIATAGATATVRFRYNTHGRTVGDLMTFINQPQYGLSATLSGGTLKIASTTAQAIGIGSDNAGLAASVGGTPLSFRFTDASERRALVGDIDYDGFTAGTLLSSRGITDPIVFTDADGDSITFASAGRTFGEFIAAVNADADFGWTADITSDGRLRLTSDAPTDRLIVDRNLAGAARFGFYSDRDDMAVSVEPGPAPAPPPAPPAETAAEVVADAKSNYRELYETLAATARDAGVAGINFAMGDIASVLVDTRGGRQSIGGLALDPASLGLIDPDAVDLSTPAGIALVVGTVAKAEKQVRIRASEAANEMALLDARSRFIVRKSDIHRHAADMLTAADVSEESAKLTAARTRYDLVLESLRRTSDGERSAVEPLIQALASGDTTTGTSRLA